MRTKMKLSLAGLVAAVAMAAVPAGASATTGTFTSGGPTPIPDNSLTLVPVTVSGLPGVITDVNVTVNEITHSDGSDIDLLLRNPNGGSVVLLSDAGGTNQAASLASMTFDDAAASLAPSSGILSGGTFKPTDYDGGDTPDPFAGAPAGPYGATLAALNGFNANATWELYARDDTAGDLGGFNNYSVTVTTNAASDPPAGPKPKKAKKKKKCKPKKGKGTVGKKPKKCKKKKGKPHQ